MPGFIALQADGELSTTALEIEDGKVAAIYVVGNPDKLRHLHSPGATNPLDHLAQLWVINPRRPNGAKGLQ